LEAHTVGDPTRPEVVGITNLPDGASLGVTLSRTQIGFTTDADATVSGGRFHFPPLTKDGGPLPPGSYRLDVSTPMARFQPPDVLALVGNEYSNYTGPRRMDPYGFGHTIEVETTYKVPGEMSADAVRKEQQRRYAELGQWARKSCAEIETPSIRASCLAETMKGVRDTMGIK